MSTENAATGLALILNGRPQQEQTQRLIEARTRFPHTDKDYTEEFVTSDGSILVYDHTANPGHNWYAK